jgi:hypothetical protein
MTRPCPRCGATDAVPVLYGYPGPEMADASERGDIRLGGCMVWSEAPDYECRACGAALPWVREPGGENEDLQPLAVVFSASRGTI